VKDFLKKAVQKPTLENVRDFYVMVDISRMKAHVFQNVAGTVWQQYPEFSLNADLPTSEAGRMAKIRMQNDELNAKILDGVHEFALIYFYSQNCEFCKVQDKILNGFINDYGWEVKKVEINENPDLASRFDVKVTPYLMLIYRNSKEYFPLAVGVSSKDEIKERLYRGMRLLSGEISPESYTMYDFQRGGKMDPSGYLTNDIKN
jgi:conjugal transfer pilus assembly protein TraF